MVAAIVVLGLAASSPTLPLSSLVLSPAHSPVVALLTALVPVMLAYNGFQNLGALGGEILNPGKIIPRAAILGTLLVIPLYVLINWVYFHLLGFSQVAQSQHVAADAAVLLLGGSGAKWFTVAMIISAFGALHATFLTGARVPYAMARDGNFFGFAKRIHPTFHTPSGAVLFQGCVSVALVLTGTHQELYSFTMFATWSFLALISIALIRLRSVEPSWLVHFAFGDIPGRRCSSARWRGYRSESRRRQPGQILARTSDNSAGRSVFCAMAQSSVQPCRGRKCDADLVNV